MSERNLEWLGVGVGEDDRERCRSGRSAWEWAAQQEAQIAEQPLFECYRCLFKAARAVPFILSIRASADWRLLMRFLGPYSRFAARRSRRFYSDLRRSH